MERRHACACWTNMACSRFWLQVLLHTKASETSSFVLSQYLSFMKNSRLSVVILNEHFGSVPSAPTNCLQLNTNPFKQTALGPNIPTYPFTPAHTDRQERPWKVIFAFPPSTCMYDLLQVEKFRTGQRRNMRIIARKLEQWLRCMASKCQIGTQYYCNLIR